MQNQVLCSAAANDGPLTAIRGTWAGTATSKALIQHLVGAGSGGYRRLKLLDVYAGTINTSATATDVFNYCVNTLEWHNRFNGSRGILQRMATYLGVSMPASPD